MNKHHTIWSFLRALPSALFRDLWREELHLHAMSLVYTTLLSLVPLLALSLSVLKGFGVHQQLQPLLQRLLAPIGDNANLLSKQIVDFVNNVRADTLGIIGLAILFYTVLTLMQKIERAFNHTWRVKHSRNLTEQFRDYLSLVLVGPILVLAALALSSMFLSSPLVGYFLTDKLVGELSGWMLEYSPIVLITIAFVLIYRFLPNTSVSWRVALIGGIVAGFLWLGVGWLFAKFVVASGQQTAIYTVFAGFFFFILWLYVVWLILLTGSSIAYYVQHPQALFFKGQSSDLAPKNHLLITLVIAREIIRRFRQQQAPLTLQELSEVVGVPESFLEPILDELVATGKLGCDNQQPARYVLLVDPGQISLEQLHNLVWLGNQQQRQYTQQLLQQNPEIPEEYLLINTHDYVDSKLTELLDEKSPTSSQSQQG